MRPSHIFHPSLLVPIAVALLATPVRAQEASDQDRQLVDILGKGSEWTTQVNGKTATLELLGGRAGRTAEGGMELTFDVAWGDVDGVLQARSDASNTVRQVTLDLTYPSGAELRCRGYLARGSDDMIAGTCGDRDAPGAWYALRRDRGPVKERPAPVAERPDPILEKPAAGRELVELRRELREASAERTTLTARANRLQNRLESVNERLQRRSRALRQCRQERGSQDRGEIEPPPVSNLKNGLTGKYEIQGKDDSVTELDFPAPPGTNSKLARWLAAHNNGLLSALGALYPQSDISQLVTAERSTCNGGVYCKMAYRQQALSAALAGTR